STCSRSTRPRAEATALRRSPHEARGRGEGPAEGCARGEQRPGLELAHEPSARELSERGPTEEHRAELAHVERELSRSLRARDLGALAVAHETPTPRVRREPRIGHLEHDVDGRRVAP